MAEHTPPTREPIPAPLRWAIWLVLTQAVAVGGVAAFLVYADVTARAESARSAVLLTVFVAIMAGLLAVLGLALARRRRWARSPAIVLQLLVIPMGYYMVAGGLHWLGFPVMVMGLVGAGALLAPATRAALGVR